MRTRSKAKNLLRKMKMVTLPVGAWPKMSIRCAQIFGKTAVPLMDYLVWYPLCLSVP